MEVSGKIKKILEPQTFSSGFTKRELILLTQEQYPQTLSIEFLQDNVNLLNTFKEGDEVRISINLRGREWINPEGVAKYFNSIVAWRIELMGTQSVLPTSKEDVSIPSKESFNGDFDSFSSDDDSSDDLPF